MSYIFWSDQRLLTPYSFNLPWQQIREHAKDWWHKITDRDLDRIQGQIGMLIGIVQYHYGLSYEEAEADIDSFLRDLAHRKPGG